MILSRTEVIEYYRELMPAFVMRVPNESSNQGENLHA